MAPRPHRMQVRRRHSGGRRASYGEVIYSEPRQLDAILECPCDCCKNTPRKTAGLDINETPPPDEYKPKKFGAGDFETEAEVENYFASTGKQIELVHLDIVANALLLPIDFLTSWAGFLDEWRIFRQKNTPVVTVFGVSLTTISNQIDMYLKRTKAFLVKARELAGANFRGTAPEIPEPPPRTNTTADITKLASIVGVLAGIIVLGPPIVKLFSNRT